MVATDVVVDAPGTVLGKCENLQGHKQFSDYGLPEWVRHPLKQEKRKLAILFPGEQSHAVGMLKDIRKKPVVRDMLEKAESMLGYDVEALMKDGPASEMKPTAVNQPLMYIADCAAFELMKMKFPEDAELCQSVCGFSVGEWAALYAAGVVTFEQGLEIVKARGEAMQELTNEVDMEALVIRGMEQDKLERFMKSAMKSDTEGGGESEVYIARYWCPEGFVCAGKASTVLKLQEVVKRDPTVAEVRLLPDHFPAAHTPMAKGAADKVAAVIDKLLPAMNPPRCEVFLNMTGWRMPPGASPFDYQQAFKESLSSPLMWDGCITQMLRWGVRKFYECGPSRSLKFMMSNFEHYIEAPVELVKPVDFTVNVIV